MKKLILILMCVFTLINLSCSTENLKEQTEDASREPLNLGTEIDFGDLPNDVSYYFNQFIDNPTIVLIIPEEFGATWYCLGNREGNSSAMGGVIYKDGVYYGVTFTLGGGGTITGTIRYFRMTYQQASNFCSGYEGTDW